MVRGSTPKHVIRVRDRDGRYIDFTTATDVTITYKQDDLMELQKRLGDGVIVDEDGNLVSELSAAETMRFFPGVARVQVEAHFGDNVIISDGATKIKIENRLKSGE